MRHDNADASGRPAGRERLQGRKCMIAQGFAAEFNAGHSNDEESHLMTATPNFRAGLGLACLAAAALAPGLSCAAPAPDINHAAVIQAVSDCRKITDKDARLACFDTAASALDQAQAQGQVMVVDRETVKTVRRQSFGFNIPSLSIFTHGPKEENIDKVTVDLSGGHVGPDGKWRFVTADDAVWRQIDSEQLYDQPHQGSKLAIRKAALGSFFCKLDGQSAVRCVRER